jgi:hypothetical protein
MLIGKYLPFFPIMILSFGISFKLMLAANINAISNYLFGETFSASGL